MKRAILNSLKFIRVVFVVAFAIVLFAPWIGLVSLWITSWRNFAVLESRYRDVFPNPSNEQDVAMLARVPLDNRISLERARLIYEKSEWHYVFTGERRVSESTQLFCRYKIADADLLAEAAKSVEEAARPSLTTPGWRQAKPIRSRNSNSPEWWADDRVFCVFIGERGLSFFVPADDPTMMLKVYEVKTDGSIKVMHIF